MFLRVSDVYGWINEIAPFETAESYDNVGLLIGSMNSEVSKILVALDATPAVVNEAIRLNAELIITHHPLMFRGTKRILEDDYEGDVITSLIRNKINLIAAHTNLDLSPEYSGSIGLAKALQLENIRQEGYLYLGELPDAPITAKDLRKRISFCEKDMVYQFGDDDAQISTLCISGGAYDEGFERARALGAQAYLTGEVRHHNALAAIGTGFVLYQGGHYGTEALLVPLLAKGLQSRFDMLKYDVTVFVSQCRPYGGNASC